MGKGTGDLLPAHRGRTGTGERAGEQIGNVFNGGGKGDGFEYRAGSKCAGEEAVEVDAFVLRVPIFDGGRIGRIKGGGGDHAQNLTGLIVVHTHRTLLTVHCLVGDIVEAGIQSEIEVVALAERVVGSGEEVIAGELVGKGNQGAGADGAGEITHCMKGSLSHSGVFIVLTVARLIHPGQYVAVPVQHPADCQGAVGVVEMPVGGKGGPITALEEEAKNKQAKAQKQQQSEGQADEGAFFNLFHGRPPFGGLCSGGPGFQATEDREA